MVSCNQMDVLGQGLRWDCREVYELVHAPSFTPTLERPSYHTRFRDACP